MRPLLSAARAPLVALTLCLTACADNTPAPASEQRPEVLTLQVSFEQEVVVASSVLRFNLPGTERLVAQRAEVSVTGVVGQREVNWQHSAQISAEAAKADDPQLGGLYRADGDTGELFLDVAMRDGLWSVLSPSPTVEARLAISFTLYDYFDREVARAALPAVSLTAYSEFAPQAQPFISGAVFLGERLEVRGANFLRPEEGSSYALITRGEVITSTGQRRDLTGIAIPLRWGGSRTRAELVISPEVFGVVTGQATADVRMVNRLADNRVFEGDSLHDLVYELQQSFITTLSPDAGSRGQQISVNGRGLIPSSGNTGMTLILEGRFIPDAPDAEEISLQGPLAQSRAPDRYVSDERVSMTVWYDIETQGAQRALTGLGAQPGVFIGTITPRLFDAFGGQQDGVPWEGTFRVLPTRQVIYLKYLPRFSEGLEKYGLRNVENELRAKILEVAQAPYAELNVEFRDTRPDDFDDFATVELSGPDPFGRKAFGYDNSFNGVAKDVDNLYLADYIGGYNQGSREAFDNPFGGIYIESFDYFSPTLTPRDAGGGPNQAASAEFDRIMRPLMPALGGAPVQATEWPNGPRAAEIQAAIDMVGNVIGNTVAHEAGHSLGLSFYPADRERPGEAFHNLTPDEGELMNAGSDRSFEERANLNGQGPAGFNARNLTYLKEILPKPR